MKKTIWLSIVLVVMLAGCQNRKSETMNPFLTEYNTPFGVPPFDKIENGHFLPAFREGIRQQEAEIDAIVSSTEFPSFENTIAAFDLSGEILRQVGGVFYRLRSAETNDEIDSIAKVLVPITSAHQSNMMLNEALFNRVKNVYERRDSLELTPEQSMVVEKVYKQFERGGANLDETGKSRIREIDERLSMLTMQFGDNLLAETNSYKMLLKTEEELAGLPESVRSAAADAASRAGQEGNWASLPFINPAGPPSFSIQRTGPCGRRFTGPCSCVATTETNMTTKRSWAKSLP